MSRDEVEKLWTRLLAGEALREDEESALLGALEADDALRAELVDDADWDGLLRGWGQGRRAEDEFLRSFACRVEAGGQESRFIRKLESRIDREKTRGSRRVSLRPSGPTAPWLALLAAAAVVLFAVLAFVASSGSPPSERTKPAGAVAEKRPASPPPPAIPGEPRPAEELPRQVVREDAQAREKELAELQRREREAAAERDRAKEADLRRAAEEAFLKIREERERAERALAESRKAPPPPTIPALASLERASGEVALVRSSGRAAARGGEALFAGDGIETSAAGGAVVAYPDGTRVELGANTNLSELRAAGGKRALIARGEVRAIVSRQPKDEPMVFATPHGEATVLGTTLRIVVDPDPKKGTRLEVEEGKVRLKNLAAKSVDVPSGHFAVAAAGVEPAVRVLPVDEVLLLASQAKLVGKDWEVVSDDAALRGQALEVSKVIRRSLQASVSDSYVSFTFQADARKDYSIWIRGRFMGEASNDCVCLAIPDGTLAVPGKPAAETVGRQEIAGFNAFRRRTGYWWVGGNANKGPDGAEGDLIPVSVRFSRPGAHTIRLYASETPIRIDAVWLSSAQKSRPAADSQGRPGTSR